MITYLKKSPLKGFFIILTFGLLLVLVGHLVVLSLLNLPLFDSKIILAYSFNYIIACLTYIMLYKYRKKHTDKLGYFFLGGSTVKFLLFFILFNPYYKLDGDVSKLEFSTFFIPYGICLIIEVIALSVLLNNNPK